jgi:hypothetical protein
MPTEKTKKPRVKFTGQNGNAFNLLGICQHAAQKAGWDKDRLDAFMAEATGGDYDHLLRTCVKHFDVK